MAKLQIDGVDIAEIGDSHARAFLLGFMAPDVSASVTEIEVTHDNIFNAQTGQLATPVVWREPSSCGGITIHLLWRAQG
jgi:hypothetical protein